MRAGETTCDPALRSWIASANQPGTDFPIQNLPLGIFRARGDQPRVGIAIGDHLLDLRGIADEGLLAGIAAATADACRTTTLNALMAAGRKAMTELRIQLNELLRDSAAPGTQEVIRPHLLAQHDAEMLLPAVVGDYTDFYASIEHATRVGRLLRPDTPLLPNYRYLPVGYHGRASSIVAGGAGICRPAGQQTSSGAPVFAPTQQLDYEAELGLFIGTGNALGEPISVHEAPQHMFGFCLLNDWSARDIQAWEYQPLGPFLGKNFATSVSPWIVTMDALEPFRIPSRPRSPGDPALLAYLSDESDLGRGAFNVQLEICLRTRAMRERNAPAVLLSRSNAGTLYWTPAQWLTHHASNGCNLRPGDLLGSGTVSGDSDDARACLLEMTSRGAHPMQLPGGEWRRYLEDGDEIILTGSCEREGATRIGFGECRGMVLPARGSNPLQSI